MDFDSCDPNCQYQMNLSGLQSESRSRTALALGFLEASTYRAAMKKLQKQILKENVSEIQPMTTFFISIDVIEDRIKQETFKIIYIKVEIMLLL